MYQNIQYDVTFANRPLVMGSSVAPSSEATSLTIFPK